MKRIFFTIYFISLFFSFQLVASAAETCSWEVLTLPTMSGGCVGKSLEKSDNAKCKSSQKKSYSDLLGQSLECCCPATIVNTEGEKPTLFEMPDFQVEIPGIKTLADVTCNPGESCDIPWIGQYTKGIYNYLLAIVGVVAAIVLMGAGIIWLTSGGESGKIEQAKNLISGAVIGIAILATSYLVLNQINPSLVNLQNISIKSVKRVEVYPDADITVVGGARTYGAACDAAKNGDWSVCKALGVAAPAGLVGVEKVKANSSVATRYKAAMECVKAKNGKYLFYINEAWRSPAAQIDYKIKSDNNGGSPLTATPCCSNHGAGQALDINRIDGVGMSFSFNESSGLRKCMEEQTLFAKLSSEPWHWSPTGR